MKKGWKIRKLGDLYEITSSKRVFRAEWKRSGVPFYRAREIVKLAQQGFVDNELYISEEMFNQYSVKYGIPKEGDIMVTGVGTLGICYVVQKNDKFYFKDGNIIWLKKKNDANSRFVEYAFKSDLLRKQIDDSVGATVGTYTIIKAKNTLIPLPPPPEQQRIVAILDEAFVAIATAKENADKNLQNSRELFESYLQSVFANPGDGWEEKTFDEVCVLQRGFDLPTHSRNAGDFPLVSSNGITDRIDVWKIKAPGVVTGRSGTIGNIHYIEEDFWPLNTALYIKDFHSNNPRCVFYFLKQFNLGQYSSGAGVPTLNRNNVHVVKVKFPKSAVEQRSIVAKLDALSAETKKLEVVYQQKLADLEELKKSILQKAFNGELAGAQS